MGLVDPEELEDDFEIEFSQITGSSRHPAIPFWSARSPDLAPTSGQRRRRYSRIAALVAIISLVLINSLTLSGIFPAGLPFVSSTLSREGMTAHAAGDSWFIAAPASAPPAHPDQWGGLPGDTAEQNSGIQLRTVTGIGDSTVFVATQYMDANGVQRPVRSNFFHLAATYRGELVTWYLKFPDVEAGTHPWGAIGRPKSPALRWRHRAGEVCSITAWAGRALPELLLSSDPGHGSPVATWATITRVASSGCYAYQVDTPTKTMVLVFEATVAP